MDATDVTSPLEGVVQALQTVIAGVLILLLVVGVVNLGAPLARAAVSRNLLNYSDSLSLIISSIDIILYLFVVVELYKTVIAYVRAESVVIAVIHAALIAVVRQIIIYKPDEVEGALEGMLVAATYAILLVALLIGFVVVHRRIDESRPRSSDRRRSARQGSPSPSPGAIP